MVLKKIKDNAKLTWVLTLPGGRCCEHLPFPRTYGSFVDCDITRTLQHVTLQQSPLQRVTY